MARDSITDDEALAFIQTFACMLGGTVDDWDQRCGLPVKTR
jgi:hypothetical protein